MVVWVEQVDFLCTAGILLIAITLPAAVAGMTIMSHTISVASAVGMCHPP